MKNQKFFVHSTAIVEDGAKLQKGVKVWHFCHVRSGAVLENDVSLGRDVYIDRNVTVGKSSRIQNGVSVYEGVKIAPYCFIGPHVIFTNDLRPRIGTKSWKIVDTVLETGMSIGAGAIVICGHKIGAFSMVAAGAIVSHDVAPFHLVQGFPARAVKMICACGQKTFPLKTKINRLIGVCCKENLQPEVLNRAKEIIKHCV